MPKLEDNASIKDEVHIVLRGPDGKVKDERKPKEVKNGNRK